MYLVAMDSKSIFKSFVNWEIAIVKFSIILAIIGVVLVTVLPPLFKLLLPSGNIDFTFSGLPFSPQVYFGLSGLFGFIFLFSLINTIGHLFMTVKKIMVKNG